jgi:lysophospholipase L1-like esterase
MKKTILLLAVLSLYGCVSKQQQVIPPDDTSIEYVGRFDFTTPSKPAFMYSGCMIRTGFNGTSLSMKLEDDSLRNWYTVNLDDSIFTFESSNADNLYVLAKNLPDREHRVEISRRTEWHGGTSKFSGFVIDPGKKLFKLPARKRTIEFIGDSFTCGYGNEGKSREEPFSYETENNYHTYGTLVARAVNANYVAVCRSGIGMYQSYGGEKEFVQPKLYDEIVVGSKAVWDYKNNEPDVVVIELGANDLAKPLDSAAFANAYIQFIKKIRGHYAHAKIVCAAGPDGLDDDKSKFQSYVKSIADQFADSDKQVYYFYFGKIDFNGSDWHPNLKEHEQLAAALLPFIKSITGW